MEKKKLGEEWYRFDCVPYRERRAKSCYKECLFSYLIKRSRKLDLETTYDCKFKFDVHRNGDAVDNPIYREHPPLDSDSDSGLDSIRLLLIVTLQWEVFPEIEPYFCTWNTGGWYQSSFVSSKSSSFSEVVDRLREIISPLISSLGLIFHEENHAVTNQFLHFANFLYSKATDFDHQLPNTYFPIALDIAVQATAPGIKWSNLIYWHSLEATRFRYGLELVTGRRDTTDPIAAASRGEVVDKGLWCSICQDSGPPVCEYVRFPHCSHSFHDYCVMRWLAVAVKPICPLCRAPVRSNEEFQWRGREPRPPRILHLF